MRQEAMEAIATEYANGCFNMEAEAPWGEEERQARWQYLYHSRLSRLWYAQANRLMVNDG